MPSTVYTGRKYPPVVQTTDGHHGRTRDGSAPLAPLAVRGAHASAAGALQAEGGSGAPEAGEGAGGAPLGGGSEDGAGALLPVESGVVRETGGERSVGVA